MNTEILRSADHRRMRWANGGGWTTEIAAFPVPDAWEWRLSIADVATDGPFSRFDGVDRTIALLGGSGFALAIGGEPERLVDRAFTPLHFDGEAATNCRLLGGPVQDLNLMVRRDSDGRELRFLELNPAEPVELVAELILVVAGSISIGGYDIGPFDAALPHGRAVVAGAAQPDQAVIAVVAVTRRLSKFRESGSDRSALLAE